MARILLGWELGAGGGHYVKLAALGRELAAQGHELLFAVQQIGLFPAEAAVWQAPLWPGQLVTLARPAAATPATMGDILAALGLDRPGALASLIAAWDRMLAATRPDVVAGDFAPALLLAARGRVPSAALGSGFTLPPVELRHFPSLTGLAPVHDEARLLDTVNAALAANGRAPRAALPELFASDLPIVQVLAELDPYRADRREPLAMPSLNAPVPAAAGQGDELFVYTSGSQPQPAAFWQGLALAGVKVRLHDPRLTAADIALLRAAGIAVEPEPLTFAAIAARSRLLLSHGGLGFATSALLAGLPQLIVPSDLEKRLIGATIAALGLGAVMPVEGITTEGFAATLRAAFGDDALAARARAAAPGFRARVEGDGHAAAAKTIADLAG